MGKLVAISVAVLAVFGSQYFMSSMSGVRATEANIADTQYEVLAREAALAGYNLAKMYLSESFVEKSFEGDYESGSYRVSIKIAGNFANILSVGTVTDAQGHEMNYDIKVKFKRTTSALPSAAPGFMQYAVLTDSDLEIDGNVTSGVMVESALSGELNSNIHTNGDLFINGNTATVNGFGSYSGTGSANPAEALYSTFTPGDNPEGLPTSYHADPVPIPEFDIESFTEAVDVDAFSSANERLSGHYDFGGTRENPYVWRIDGDLIISSTTVLDGYNIFLVNGNFDIKGELLRGETGYGGDESSIGIYASGNFDLSGNNKVEAQVFAGGDVTMLAGTPMIIGSITTHGKLDLRGTPTVAYRGASPALTTIWQGQTSELDLIGYFER